MSMNLTKLAKKIVQDNRDKKKNTDSSAEFHQNQLESICVFYLLASFCPASWLMTSKEFFDPFNKFVFNGTWIVAKGPHFADNVTIEVLFETKNPI